MIIIVYGSIMMQYFADHVCMHCILCETHTIGMSHTHIIYVLCYHGNRLMWLGVYSYKIYNFKTSIDSIYVYII